MKTLEIDALMSSYLMELKNALEVFPFEQIAKLGKILLSLSDAQTLYVVGNGGSATTASHMATDLGVGSLRRRNPVRCVSLVDNSGVLTATSNDLDFKSVYKQQVRLLGRSGDVLICFSASGNSVNLIDAVLTAKEMGVFTVGITGFDGGKLKEICDLSVHTPTNIGSYGVVEDLHSSVSHVLTEVVRNS